MVTHDAAHLSGICLVFVLAIGVSVGPIKLAGFNLGKVIAKLLTAVVGISAGPDFVAGLARAEISIVVAAAMVLVAQTCGLLVGHRLFKMRPGVLLRVCAGAFTTTPALTAIQEQARRSMPTLGYSVGDVLLALWGTVIVALLA